VRLYRWVPSFFGVRRVRGLVTAPVRSPLVEHDLSFGGADVDDSEADDGTDDDGATPTVTTATATDAADPEATPDDVDIALLDAIERELADVALALERLGDGSYGRCETCGEAFSDDELEAAPAGRFCRAHLPLGMA
jgi:RNA polymerase-binding transcription factor DksA